MKFLIFVFMRCEVLVKFFEFYFLARWSSVNFCKPSFHARIVTEGVGHPTSYGVSTDGEVIHKLFTANRSDLSDSSAASDLSD